MTEVNSQRHLYFIKGTLCILQNQMSATLIDSFYKNIYETVFATASSTPRALSSLFETYGFSTTVDSY